MPDPALVLTLGRLRTSDAKTAHGLIRGSARFRVLGVVDGAESAGRDAGELLDGRARGIPVFADLEHALQRCEERPRWLVVGVATFGGRLPAEMRAVLRAALGAGLSLVCGLHELLVEDPELVALAARRGLELVDVRRPKPRSELHFWNGEVLSLRAPRIPVLGTDCALGKRTTARLLTQALAALGRRAEMIYTGQTGWMQGHRFGFVLDATPNDFVAGELEHALLECAREANPEVMFLEGQAALRHPAGPCGAELVVSAGARHVILQHAPARRFYEDFEHLEIEIPPVEDEIALLRHYGARVIGIAVNQEGLSLEATRAAARELATRTGLPTCLPIADGALPLVPAVLRAIDESKP
ncbi:MAG: DUF1611 domain-containing protein [Planctomycetes bacterium]|nr:DUF1611 domain-containing protein [Planctomycetota bacterium]